MAGEVGISPWQQVVASTSGAVLTAVFVTPLDVVKIRLQKQVKTRSGARLRWNVTPLDVAKVRLQAQTRPLMQGRCFVYSNGLMDHLCTCANASATALQNCEWYQRPSMPSKFTGTLDAMRKIARTEGIRSLWSGLSPTLVMALPATVCYFTLYDNLHLRLKEKIHQSWLAPTLAGTTARGVVVTLVSPLELIRTKIQSEKLSYSAVGNTLKTAIKEQGIFSLWRGVGPTILRDVPFSAIYWTIYETLKSRVIELQALEKPTFGIGFSCGAFAGSVAAFLTVPFDVIKTHRQIEIGENSALKNTTKAESTSTYALMKRLVAREGYQSLFAGAVPRVVKIAPACAIMIGTYEYLKQFFAQKNKMKA